MIRCAISSTKRLFPSDEVEEEKDDSEQLAQVRRDLEAKARDVWKLRKELDSLSRKLEQRETQPEPPPPPARRGPPRPPQSSPPAEAAPSANPAGPPEPEVKAMRERIES